MSKTILLVVAAVALLMIPSTAIAGGPPQLFTETGTGSVIDIPFEGCGGVPGVVSVEFRFRVHVTDFGDGRMTVSMADWGTFEFDPIVGQSSSGHYRNGSTLVVTDNTVVETAVFAGSGTFEDGTHAPFVLRSHVTIANGQVRVDDVSVMCTAA